MISSKTKLGRQYYSGSAVADFASNIPSPVLVSFNNFKDSGLDRQLIKIWNALKGDWYLVHTASGGEPPVDFDSGLRSEYSTQAYYKSINKHLYWNSLLAKLCLSYRYIVNIQVSILRSLMWQRLKRIENIGRSDGLKGSPRKTRSLQLRWRVRQ